MGKRRVTLDWANQRVRRANIKTRLAGLIKKTNELSILCDARDYLVVFNREIDQFVVWPSTQEANSLMEKYYSLTERERSKKAVDPELFIEANIQKIEKKIDDARKAIEELEMEHLMLLNHGRVLADLSLTLIDKLRSYTGKKITSFRNEIMDLDPMSVDEASPEDTILSDSNVPSAGWTENGYNVMETTIVRYYDDWGVSNENRLPKMVNEFDLNMEPSDVGEENLRETSKEESIKNAGGAEE
ncbi:truncated transcription factor CAULIFLOWER A-like [Capsella rubella]|uniref:truncated transcription factor CAULIFLOWER A-like n=1 Tax=Capsella rubella TaxID=81985 RepID=UPI000CD4A699|nr:truncated transcription factor CAULIFLOWER A-like [Capsella rubella]